MKTRFLTAMIAVIIILLALAPAALAAPVVGASPEPTATGNAATAETPDVSTTAGTPTTADLPTAFTPDGTGTVVNYANDGAGKEFYVIQAVDGHVFYLVIDTEKSSQNVYFLNVVTLDDLLPLAAPTESGGAGSSVNVTPSAPVMTPTTDTVVTPSPSPSPVQTTPAQTQTQSGGNSGTLFLVIAVVLIGGGTAYYFKVYRPKHHGTVNPEVEDYDPEDKSEPDDWDEQEIDAPDSDDDEGGGDEQ